MSVLSWRLFLYFFYHWPSFDFFYLSLTITWMVFVFFNSFTIGRHSIGICFLYFFYHWPSFDWCSFSLFFFIIDHHSLGVPFLRRIFFVNDKNISPKLLRFTNFLLAILRQKQQNFLCSAEAIYILSLCEYY